MIASIFFSSQPANEKVSLLPEDPQDVVSGSQVLAMCSTTHLIGVLAHEPYASALILRISRPINAGQLSRQRSMSILSRDEFVLRACWSRMQKPRPWAGCGSTMLGVGYIAKLRSLPFLERAQVSLQLTIDVDENLQISKMRPKGRRSKMDVHQDVTLSLRCQVRRGISRATVANTRATL